MSKNKNNFKCPKCGDTSYTEYNDKLRNGAIGAAVGAFLLGPIAQEKKARGAAGKSFGSIATNQFKNGYQQAMSQYSDDD